MGRQLTIDIPDDLLAALLRVAADCRLSPEELAFHCVESAVRRVDEDPLLRLAGAIHLEPAATGH